MHLSWNGWLSQLWTRFWLRNVSFRGRYNNLERLYALNDPWKLKSAKEQRRFEACNAVIAKYVPDCRTLLELGSGEGVQTRWLQLVSEQVTGIEVSRSAVQRARLFCPDVQFHHEKIEDVSAGFGKGRFDLVTAFEVLYYVSDIATTLATLQELGEYMLVTNYSARADAMREHFQEPGWTRLDDIVVEETTWEVQLWRREPA